MSASDFSWPLMKDSITFCDRVKLAKFVMSADKFTQGDKVEEFEQAWSDWLGAEHSLFVSSGSTANFLLIASLMEYYNLMPGSKVLVPACTWVTNINPIIQLGLRPIFCDVNLTDFSFDLSCMERIKLKHPDIAAIFVTHLLGFPAKNYEYQKLFPYALIIDDVCESHGCIDTDTGYKVGARSLGATFSFYFGHHMSTVEGGMISTNNRLLYDLMKMKRSHGLARSSDFFDSYTKKYPDIEKQFLFVTDGYNFRNTELAAVLGLSQLKRLDSFIQTRKHRFAEFYLIMHGINMTRYEEFFYPIRYDNNNSSFCFPFVCKSKEIKQKLIDLFDKNGIEYRPIVGGNLLRQPYLKDYVIEEESGAADLIHENGVYIGNNQFVTSKDMLRLEEILKELK